MREVDAAISGMRNVAPPRGERGLKYYHLFVQHFLLPVAPPRGERGLKYLCTGFP